MDTRRFRRRWFQMSLRSLFLLILLVATWLAGYTTAIRKAEQETRQAEQAAEAARLEAAARAAEARSKQDVAAALRWLARQQQTTGSWSIDSSTK